MIINPTESNENGVVMNQTCRFGYEGHMGSFAHPQHIFAAAQENRYLRTPCRGPS